MTLLKQPEGVQCFAQCDSRDCRMLPQPPIVIDFGAHECRVGIASEAARPQYRCASLVGRKTGGEASALAKAEAAMASMAGMAKTKEPLWFGEELPTSNVSGFSIACPITAGRITRWVSSTI